VELYDITKKWLEENGYDGLCYEECGCELEDFMPCGEPSPRCEAGHREKAPRGSGFDYFIYPGKGNSEEGGNDEKNG
jgi:hypothetical protein